jgi:hypothetical protein
MLFPVFRSGAGRVSPIDWTRRGIAGNTRKQSLFSQVDGDRERDRPLCSNRFDRPYSRTLSVRSCRNPTQLREESSTIGVYFSIIRLSAEATTRCSSFDSAATSLRSVSAWSRIAGSTNRRPCSVSSTMTPRPSISSAIRRI